MTTPQCSSASLIIRHGFILVHETLCDGVIPAESDGESQIVIYETLAEAEYELDDSVEMRAEAMGDAQMEHEDDEDDRWVEAAVLHPDGTLVLINQGMAITANAFRALWR